ncbi:hypothetical protein [Microvirga guangxiensis]|uniref:Uncharacterized protein n=1 Tax=Microvirga guangxiensis TaxID=549386 RepID=A0A1G5L6Q5_9HYPH|nr:hypothetical protein [Microvirga guangxiensis]SCZ07950.1 hypothetical protein SAMN02927923_03937 [Microvirga guangxiensis]
MRILSKSLLTLAGAILIAAPSVAQTGPTKGRFEIRIVSDKTASGHSERNVNIFKLQHHQEAKLKATFVFTHTDANDSVAEGYKDASAALHQKLKPLEGSANKIKSSGLLGGGGLMEMMEKCSDLEDDDEIQACMMKAAGGLQAQMQEKCKKDPSLCAAIEDVQDEDNVSSVEAGARELQEAMTKFRHYTSDSCSVEAAIDYAREDEFPSDRGGRVSSRSSTKTNGTVRGVPRSGNQACTLTVAVGPDNTMSFKLVLSDAVGFPASIAKGSTTSAENAKLQLGPAFNPYMVKKHKSVSGGSYSGEQTISQPKKTVKEGESWTVTSSGQTKIDWSMKLD